MKKLLILMVSVSFFTALPYLTIAQTPDTVWTHIIDKSRDQILFDIFPVSDGFIAGGYTTEDNNYDGLMMKFNNDGKLVWDKTYGEPEKSEKLNCMIETADGGYMLAGSKEGLTSVDAWFVKTDSSGNTEWNNRVGNDDVSDGVNSVVQTTDSSFMACGTIWNSVTSGYDIIVYKITVDGGLVFRNVFNLGGISAEYAYSIAAGPEGSAVIGGRTQVNNPLFDFDIFLLKVDAFGGMQLISQIGDDDPFNESCSRLTHTSDGGYLIAGFQDNDGWNKQWFNVKTNAGGFVEWTHTIGGPYHEVALGSCETENGDFIVSGNYWDETWNGFLVKYSPTGDTLWTKMIKHDNKNIGLTSVNTIEGGDIIASGSASDASDVDAYICRITEKSNGIQPNESETSENNISVFQKQNSEFIMKYNSKTKENFSLVVSDINGRMIYRSNKWSTHKGLNTKHLYLDIKPGIYLINLQNEKNRLSGKFVVSR